MELNDPVLFLEATQMVQQTDDCTIAVSLLPQMELPLVLKTVSDFKAAVKATPFAHNVT